MMKLSHVMAVLLAVAAVAHPASRQRKHDPPPPPDEEQVGTQTLPPQVCPSDFRDGPLYADGRTCYGIPALGIVEGFLAPPQDAGDPWKDVGPASLRVLADSTDYDACLRLTTIITGGERSAPAPRTWVYFTAGGFYFVSQWKPAQALSNYTTSYGHVMVYDSAFTLLGAFAL
jgi:hypothetical protein